MHVTRSVFGILAVCVLLAGCSSSGHHGLAGDVEQPTVDIVQSDTDHKSADLSRHGVVWEVQSPDPAPGKRAYHSMAYDAHRRVIVLYGGDDGDRKLDDLWEWDGSGWRQVKYSQPGPGPVAGQRMVYDPLRKRTLLLFGEQNEVFSWDGSQWSRLETGCSSLCPGQRSHHSVAYLEHTRQVLLFGGANSNSLLNETHVLGQDGKWILLSGSPARPERRRGASLFYHPVQRMAFLFGGIDSDDQYPADLWRFADGAWSKQPLTQTPAGRRAALFLWFAPLGTALLIGGYNHELSSLFGGALVGEKLGIWSFDGSKWTPLPESYLLAADRFAQAGAVDPERDELLQNGGHVSGLYPSDSNYLLRLHGP